MESHGPQIEMLSSGMEDGPDTSLLHLSESQRIISGCH